MLDYQSAGNNIEQQVEYSKGTSLQLSNKIEYLFKLNTLIKTKIRFVYEAVQDAQ